MSVLSKPANYTGPRREPYPPLKVVPAPRFTRYDYGKYLKWVWFR